MTGLLVYGKSAISMFFLGKIGKEALAGGSLAISIANISGYSVISGLAAGMEGISSQAFGAHCWPLLSQTLQRTITILTITCIPISLLWLNSEAFFVFWGQSPAVSSVATTYLSFSIPTLLFQSLINPLKIYLRTQNVTFPLMLGSTLALAVHAPANYLLICHLRFGIRAIALAGALADLNVLGTLLLYLLFSGMHKRITWRRGSCWSVHFADWKPILCQAVPSCVSVCLEWWWYELMILLSGLLDDAAEAVAAMGILIQATALVYQFPFALNQAASTRVGNELGADSPGRAKTTSLVALLCGALTGLAATSFMVTMRGSWGRIFTADGAVVSLTAMALPIAGLCELGNCPQTTACGVLRGSARSTLGACVNFGSFYVVGFPIALLMGFVMDMGLLGLWLGLLAAQMVCAVVMVVVLLTTDWKAQAERARELTTSSAMEDQAQPQSTEVNP